MAAKKLLDGATATGVSTNITNGLAENQSVQINLAYTVVPTAVVIGVEGSLDGGVTWDELVEKTMTSGEMAAKIASLSIVGQPRDVIRHKLKTLTGGTAVAVTTYHGQARHANP